MEDYGSIDPMTAIKDYGCMRLSARIFDLRELGYDIDKENITVKTRHGKTKVARYRLNG